MSVVEELELDDNTFFQRNVDCCEKIDNYLSLEYPKNIEFANLISDISTRTDFYEKCLYLSFSRTKTEIKIKRRVQMSKDVQNVLYKFESMFNSILHKFLPHKDRFMYELFKILSTHKEYVNFVDNPQDLKLEKNIELKYTNCVKRFIVYLTIKGLKKDLRSVVFHILESKKQKYNSSIPYSIIKTILLKTKSRKMAEEFTFEYLKELLKLRFGMRYLGCHFINVFEEEIKEILKDIKEVVNSIKKQKDYWLIFRQHQHYLRKMRDFNKNKYVRKTIKMS